MQASGLAVGQLTKNRAEGFFGGTSSDLYQPVLAARTTHPLGFLPGHRPAPAVATSDLSE